jgi:hypothetical protein
MVVNIASRFPVIGDLVAPIQAKKGSEFIRGALRLVVAAVAIIAFNFFPALTARAPQLPYVGVYFAQAVARFHLLSPLTQNVAIGVISLPALLLTGGVYFISSAVTAFAQAQLTMTAIAGLDILSKALTGALLLRTYRDIRVGILETVSA